jgi:hypothetical protein
MHHNAYSVDKLVYVFSHDVSWTRSPLHPAAGKDTSSESLKELGQDLFQHRYNAVNSALTRDSYFSQDNVPRISSRSTVLAQKPRL